MISRTSQHGNNFPSGADQAEQLARLLDATSNGPGQWVARCPSHEDATPSLSISVSNSGRLLVHCHAGCTFSAVMSAAGMSGQSVPKATASAKALPPKTTPTPSSVDAGYLRHLIDAGRDKLPALACELSVSVQSLQALLVGWCNPEKCWTMPERSADGIITGLMRRFSDGKKMMMKGHSRGLYFCDGWDGYNGPVLIPEGMSDTAAAITLGLSAIGRPAAIVPRDVFQWLVGKLKDLPIDRSIVVVAEGDEAGRNGAIDTAKKLTAALGRTVQCALPGGECKDTRAWLVAHPGATGEDYLAGLVYLDVPDDADDQMRHEAMLSLAECNDDPARLARCYLSEHPHVRYWQAEFFEWNGVCYRSISDDQLRAALHQAIEAQFLDDWETREEARRIENATAVAAGEIVKEGKANKKMKVTTALIANVIASLKADQGVILPEGTHCPAWLTPTPYTASRCIVTKNGIVAIDATDGDMLVDSTPDFFAVNAVPYEYDAGADCPRWFDFLSLNLEDDARRIELLQEWYGYCLTTSVRYQKFLLLFGEGSTGKSVACAVLRAMLGERNCSAVPLDNFSDRFSLFQTIGKLANIAADTNEIDKAAEGHLKSFSSGDRMQFERKYQQPVEAIPTAKLIVATNALPHFSDRSSGIWRRLSIILFNRMIQESEKVRGMDTPEWWHDAGELPGILNWAIHGLSRLEQVGHFTDSDICNQVLEVHRTVSNPARAYLLEHYQVTYAGYAEAMSVYEDYSRWCNRHGFHPLNAANFGKEVPRAFPGSTKQRPRLSSGRTWVYGGICRNVDA